MPESPAPVCSAGQSRAPVGPGAAATRLPGQKSLWSPAGPRGAVGACALHCSSGPGPSCYCLTFCLTSAILLFIRSYLQRTQLGIPRAPLLPLQPRRARPGLLHGHGRGAVDGLHDGRKAAAQVVGGVGPDLRGLLQHNDLGGAVQEPGQQLTQLHLQLGCQGERRTQSVAATAEGSRPQVKELWCLLQAPLPALRAAQPVTKAEQWLLRQRSLHQAVLPASQASVREAPLPPGCPSTGPRPTDTRDTELSLERCSCPGCQVKNHSVLQGDTQILTVQLRGMEPPHPVHPQTGQFSPC